MVGLSCVIVLLLQCCITQTTGSEKNIQHTTSAKKMLTRSTSIKMSSPPVEERDVNRTPEIDSRKTTLKTLPLTKTPIKILPNTMAAIQEAPFSTHTNLKISSLNDIYESNTPKPDVTTQSIPQATTRLFRPEQLTLISERSSLDTHQIETTIQPNQTISNQITSSTDINNSQSIEIKTSVTSESTTILSRKERKSTLLVKEKSAALKPTSAVYLTHHSTSILLNMSIIPTIRQSSIDTSIVKTSTNNVSYSYLPSSTSVYGKKESITPTSSFGSINETKDTNAPTPYFRSLIGTMETIIPSSTNTTLVLTATFNINQTYLPASPFLNGTKETITLTSYFSSLNGKMDTIKPSSSNTTMISTSIFNQTYLSTSTFVNGTRETSSIFSSITKTVATIKPTSTNTTTRTTSTFNQTYFPTSKFLNGSKETIAITYGQSLSFSPINGKPSSTYRTIIPTKTLTMAYLSTSKLMNGTKETIISTSLSSFNGTIVSLKPSSKIVQTSTFSFIQTYLHSSIFLNGQKETITPILPFSSVNGTSTTIKPSSINRTIIPNTIFNQTFLSMSPLLNRTKTTTIPTSHFSSINGTTETITPSSTNATITTTSTFDINQTYISTSTFFTSTNETNIPISSYISIKATRATIKPSSIYPTIIPPSTFNYSYLPSTSICLDSTKMTNIPSIVYSSIITTILTIRPSSTNKRIVQTSTMKIYQTYLSTSTLGNGIMGTFIASSSFSSFNGTKATIKASSTISGIIQTSNLNINQTYLPSSTFVNGTKETILSTSSFRSINGTKATKKPSSTISTIVQIPTFSINQTYLPSSTFVNGTKETILSTSSFRSINRTKATKKPSSTISTIVQIPTFSINQTYLPSSTFLNRTKYSYSSINRPKATMKPSSTISRIVLTPTFHINQTYLSTSTFLNGTKETILTTSSFSSINRTKATIKPSSTISRIVLTPTFNINQTYLSASTFLNGTKETILTTSSFRSINRAKATIKSSSTNRTIIPTNTLNQTHISTSTFTNGTKERTTSTSYVNETIKSIRPSSTIVQIFTLSSTFLNGAKESMRSTSSFSSTNVIPISTFNQTYFPTSTFLNVSKETITPKLSFSPINGTKQPIETSSLDTTIIPTNTLTTSYFSTSTFVNGTEETVTKSSSSSSIKGTNATVKQSSTISRIVQTPTLNINQTYLPSSTFLNGTKETILSTSSFRSINGTKAIIKSSSTNRTIIPTNTLNQMHISTSTFMNGTKETTTSTSYVNETIKSIRPSSTIVQIFTLSSTFLNGAKESTRSTSSFSSTTIIPTSTFDQAYFHTSTLLNGSKETITPSLSFSTINGTKTTIKPSSTNRTIIPTNTVNKTYISKSTFMNGTGETIKPTASFSSMHKLTSTSLVPISTLSVKDQSTLIFINRTNIETTTVPIKTFSEKDKDTNTPISITKTIMPTSAHNLTHFSTSIIIRRPVPTSTSISLKGQDTSTLSASVMFSEIMLTLTPTSNFSVKNKATSLSASLLSTYNATSLSQSKIFNTSNEVSSVSTFAHSTRMFLSVSTHVSSSIVAFPALNSSFSPTTIKPSMPVMSSEMKESVSASTTHEFLAFSILSSLSSSFQKRSKSTSCLGGVNQCITDSLFPTRKSSFAQFSTLGASSSHSVTLSSKSVISKSSVWSSSTVSIFPTTIYGRKFKGLLTFPHLPFSEALLDKSSTDFKALAQKIRHTFLSAYEEKVDGFLHLNILSFAKAKEGVVCELTVMVDFHSSTTVEKLEIVTLEANEASNVGQFKVTSASFVDWTKEVEPKRRLFVATATIQNKKFKEALKDHSSQEFKNMSKDFEAALNKMYSPTVNGFLYTRVTSFEKGSIICTFLIVTTFQSSANEIFLTKILRHANVTDNLNGFIIKDDVAISRIEQKTQRSEKNLDEWLIITIAGVCSLVMVMVILVIVCIQHLRRQKRQLQLQVSYHDWQEDPSTIEIREYKKRTTTQVRIENNQETRMEMAVVNIEESTTARDDNE